MISIVVAHSTNRVIGKDNDLPWKIPSDLANFRKLTTGKTVVMGRKTFDSLGKPLKNRKNVVLTGNDTFAFEGVEVVRSVEEVLALDTPDSELCIIGGETVYKQFLPYVSKMYITLVEGVFEGDAFFPEFDEEGWFLAPIVDGLKDEANQYDYSFRVYEKLNVQAVTR
jgi:dihydrofolate reductase